VPNLSYSAADSAGTRLYLLSVPSNDPTASAELLIFDLTTGALAATVPSIVSDPLAIAVSQDGSCVYIASGNSSGVAISRYNVSLAAVDLDWNVPDSSSASVTGLATVAGSPQTVVALTGGVATIYDGSQPRWRTTAYPVADEIIQPPVLATASRVYFSNQPGVAFSSACWQWLDFDMTGVISAQNQCAGQPDGMLQEGVLRYLTDGQRAVGVSLPGTGVSTLTQPQVLAVDLAGGNAYAGGISPSLTEFNLSTGAQTSRQFQFNNTGTLPAFFVAQGGAVFVQTGYQIQLLQ
jgi:DNA-binding beta-propeller fold protein YncE